MLVIFITAVVGAILLFFFYKTFDIYTKRRKYKHIPGPPTNGLIGFYTGHYREINSALKNGNTYLDLFNEWFEENISKRKKLNLNFFFLNILKDEKIWC